jgi:hypothetical protein
MKVPEIAVTTAAACAGLAALLIYADAGQSLKIDFSDETVGAESKSFVSVVGVWRIEAEGNNKVGRSGSSSCRLAPTNRAGS